MSKTIITNLTKVPFRLPEPFYGVIQSGRSGIVTGARVDVRALLGGDAIDGALRLSVGLESDQASHDGITTSTDIAVAQSATGVQVVAADGTAGGLILENDAADDFYGKWAPSGTTVTSTDRSFVLAPGERALFEGERASFAKLRLIGIWAAAGGGTLRGSRAR